MLELKEITKFYNELNSEIARLNNVANLTKWWYFESLLSDIDWHKYFLYRIANEEYFDYFLINKDFWEQVKDRDFFKKADISLKNYDYIKWFEAFDKLKNNENFIKYFDEYKAIKLNDILNKQNVISFDQTIRALQKLKEYKPNLEINFFELDVKDYEKFVKLDFNTEKSVVSDYLRKSAIYDFDFEKFYQLKKQEIEKQILKAENNTKELNEAYHNLWILNTYHKFYKLHNSLVNLSYFKIALLKFINFWNIFDGTRNYLLPLLIFHFSKTKQEAQKIDFIFRNHFVYFVAVIWLLLVAFFGNNMYLIAGIIIFLAFVIIVKLVLNFIERVNFANAVKVVFAMIVFSYWVFNLFVNPITNWFLQSLPEQGIISVLINKEDIQKEKINDQIKNEIYKFVKQTLDKENLQTNITNFSK